MKTTYICQLSNEVQESIQAELIALDLSTEDVELAMNSRLCDLEDTININKYL